MVYQVDLYIIKSNCDLYIENQIKNISLYKKIGEGYYGGVYEIGNNHVIKLFKSSTVDTTILKDTPFFLPPKWENREYVFFQKILQESSEQQTYLIDILAIGFIKDKIVSTHKLLHPEKSYFLILPYVIPFYTIINTTIIDDKDIIKIMIRLLEISLYLETKHKKINLDLKLQNCAFCNENNSIDNIILFDFGLVKNYESHFYLTNKVKNNIQYYLWSIEEDNQLEHVHSYSVCINGLELIFGYDVIHKSLPNKIKLNQFLEKVKLRNEQLYDIFFMGLYMKMKTDHFIQYLNQFS